LAARADKEKNAEVGAPSILIQSDGNIIASIVGNEELLPVVKGPKAKQAIVFA